MDKELPKKDEVWFNKHREGVEIISSDNKRTVYRYLGSGNKVDVDTDWFVRLFGEDYDD